MKQEKYIGMDFIELIDPRQGLSVMGTGPAFSSYRSPGAPAAFRFFAEAGGVCPSQRNFGQRSNLVPMPWDSSDIRKLVTFISSRSVAITVGVELTKDPALSQSTREGRGTPVF
jgi:hypothetical protein